LARYIEELCHAMVFEQIDRIKREYTDKYVVVDDRRPELARFKGVVGRVKTVNMSGRALVEFNAFHKNIGWYDIDIDYLKVVDKPAPREKVAKERTRPAANKRVAAKASPSAKKLSPLEMARIEGAAKKKGARPTRGASSPPANAATDRADTSERPAATKRNGGTMSVADILAAARGAQASKKATAAVKQTKSLPPAAHAQPPTKVEPGKKKMSVADILAAARAEKRAVASPPDASSPEQAASQPASASAAHQEPAGEAAEPAMISEAEPGLSQSPAAEQTTPAAPRGGKVDRSRMSVAEIVAWCREHDG